MTPELLTAWAEYIQHRVEMGSPLTPLATKKAFNKLTELSMGNSARAVAILNQSMESMWLGLFPLKPENEQRFLARERALAATKKIKCQHCGLEIEEGRWPTHLDRECTMAPKAQPEKLGEMVGELAKKWGKN